MTRGGRGEGYAALAAIGYGSAYVATAFALRSLEPLPLAVWRSLLAAIGLGLAALVLRRRRSPGTSSFAPRPPVTVRAAHLLVAGSLGGPIFLAGMNFAVAGVGATIAAFVAGLYAVLAAVLAPFLLREPLRPRTLAGFLAALVGTAFLAELDLAGSGATGIAWGLIAAVAFALFLVLSRRWSRVDGFDGIDLALAATSTAAIGLGVLVGLTDPGSLVPAGASPEALVALAWLAFVAAGGSVLAVSSVRLVPASRTAAFLLLNPVSATILSFALLGERPAPVQVAGGALVLAGIAAATIERGTRPAT